MPDIAARLIVAACVAAAAAVGVLKLDDTLGALDLRADANAAYSYDERTYPGAEWVAGNGSVLEDARLLMPEDAVYRVVLGPEFENIQYSSFARYFLLGLLLPRRQTDLESASWAFCYGCDDSTLGHRFQVLSNAGGGPAFGRMLP